MGKNRNFNMGNCFSCHSGRSAIAHLCKKKVSILLLGFDGAGKSTIAQRLCGEKFTETCPNVGYEFKTLKYKGYTVTVYDIGGAPNIRDIWPHYYADVHGVIFVVDSSDQLRLEENKTTLQKVMSNVWIRGKPILILCNKQDEADALDGIDLEVCLNVETLANWSQTRCRVVPCDATRIDPDWANMDPELAKGYWWLLDYIISKHRELSERVNMDITEKKRQKELSKKLAEESKKVSQRRQKVDGVSKPSSILPTGTNSNLKLFGNVTNNVISSNSNEVLTDMSSEDKDTIKEQVIKHLDLPVVSLDKAPKKVRNAEHSVTSELQKYKQCGGDRCSLVQVNCGGVERRKMGCLGDSFETTVPFKGDLSKIASLKCSETVHLDLPPVEMTSGDTTDEDSTSHTNTSSITNITDVTVSDGPVIVKKTRILALSRRLNKTAPAPLPQQDIRTDTVKIFSPPRSSNMTQAWTGDH